MARRGAFILFEGLDRCGKTSQSQKLVEYLNSVGHKAELLRFPDRNTSIGVMLDAYLRKTAEQEDHAIHLIFSANRWEKKDLILNKLRAGCTLVVDSRSFDTVRYAFSGAAFTSFKGYDLEWCKSADRGLPAPDIVVSSPSLYMKVPVEVALSRGGAGEERFENVEDQKKVQNIFENQLADSTWTTVDGNRPMDVIQTDLQNISKRVISEVGDKPIGVLWQK